MSVAIRGSVRQFAFRMRPPYLKNQAKGVYGLFLTIHINTLSCFGNRPSVCRHLARGIVMAWKLNAGAKRVIAKMCGIFCATLEKLLFD
jgi:hypothetical protein